MTFLHPKHPAIRKSRPGDRAIDVDPAGFVAADLILPNGRGVMSSSVNESTVTLRRADNGQPVSSFVNTSGAGDALVLKPAQDLEPNTRYTFEVTSGVTDAAGAHFIPYSASFSTGRSHANASVELPGVGFTQEIQASTLRRPIIALTVGPDHRMYANTADGDILRFEIAPDGSLVNPYLIDSVRKHNGGQRRLLTSICFDPSATAMHLVAWVNHTQYRLDKADDWEGKLSRLTGPDLEDYQDYLVNLPRSVRDHVNNRIHFGPDGKLYFAQGSSSAMGAPDPTWGNRQEHLLTGAMLSFDPAQLANPPLDVKTVDAGGSYDPFDAHAPLRVYASGIRNAFDFCFHSNGHLYAPTNGSAAGGSTPGYAGNTISSHFREDGATRGTFEAPPVPALFDIPETEEDWLFDVVAGAYYGHPNPSRGEFVFDGGHPTTDVKVDEISAYPVGVRPDRNYRRAIYDLGKNVSPDGVVEYVGDAFGDRLNKCLFITRYSGGKDVVVVRLTQDGAVDKVVIGVPGLTKIFNPVGIEEDRTSGFLYVAEFGALGSFSDQRVVLLRPLANR